MISHERHASLRIDHLVQADMAVAAVAADMAAEATAAVRCARAFLRLY